MFIKKLGDSKNIIRAEALRALVKVYDILRKCEEQSKTGNSSGIISMVLLYLKNSSNWHVREELLNALTIWFIKAQQEFEYDPAQIMEALISLLNDQKDRVRSLAKECLVAYSYYVNKYNFKELLFQLCDPLLT